MATGLQARNWLTIFSGGYPGEETGGSGAYNDWTDVPLSGSTTATYYYRDSDSASNSNSILVHVTVTDQWSSIINNDNSIIVSTVTTIDKIEKVSITGNPGSTPRDIGIKQQASDGGWLYFFDNTPMSLHVVASNLGIGARTSIINPSTEWGQNTVYFRSAVNGHIDDPTPSIYVDEMGMGLTFRNILPPDYRPGQRKIGGSWYSHNRAVGVCNRKVAGVWTEMRTYNGGVGTDNPPKIKTNGTWYNQKKIGQE